MEILIRWATMHPIGYIFGAIATGFLVSQIYGWRFRRASRKDGWHQTRSWSDAFAYGDRWEKIPDQKHD